MMMMMMKMMITMMNKSTSHEGEELYKDLDTLFLCVKVFVPHLHQSKHMGSNPWLVPAEQTTQDV